MFFQLYSYGIDGSDETLAVEFVAFTDDVDVFAFPQERFVATLRAEITQVAILAICSRICLRFNSSCCRAASAANPGPGC
jgi:hypothetical protein